MSPSQLIAAFNSDMIKTPGLISLYLCTSFPVKKKSSQEQDDTHSGVYVTHDVVDQGLHIDDV